MSLAEFIAEMRDGDDEDFRGRRELPHVGQIALIKEMVPVFTAPNPYKVGDWITPRKSGPIKDAGNPCVVIDVRERTTNFNPAINSDGSPQFGDEPDIRVIRVVPGQKVVAFWTRSEDHEPYIGEPTN